MTPANRDRDVSASELPVIDLAPLRVGPPASRDGVGAAIREACETTGFFYLRGHGVAAETIGDALSASAAFFALPEADKPARGI